MIVAEGSSFIGGIIAHVRLSSRLLLGGPAGYVGAPRRSSPSNGFQQSSMTARWKREEGVRALVKNLRADGWDLSLPRRASHEVCVRTEADANALASKLADVGYELDGPFEDRDYERWELTVSEGQPVLVTAEALLALQARLEPLVLSKRGWLNGVGVSALADER